MAGLIDKIKNAGKDIVLTGLCLLALNGCGDGKPTYQPVRDEKPTYQPVQPNPMIPVTPAPISQENRKSVYFPLAEGNTWTYEKQVFQQGKSIFILRYTLQEDSQLGFKKGQSVRGIGKNTLPSKEKSTEKYTVLSNEAGSLFWNVLIEGENPRDGRYSGIAEDKDNQTRFKAQWGYNNETGIIMEILEGNIWGAKASTFTSIGNLQDGVINNAGERNTYEIGALPSSSPVKVKAGTFNDCFVNLIVYYGEYPFGNNKIEEAVPNLTDKERSAYTRIFYAPNVGVVKEEQFDPKGNRTYTLELIDYKINK